MKQQVVVIPYEPNPKQYKFHSLKSKYRGFCGGWGNGKTSGGCAEFFTRLMEFPGTRAIISRKTRPELRATTWDMLVNGDVHEKGWRGIPPEVIATNNRSDLFIELRNGSKIYGMPLDDPKKIENFNLGLYLIDQAEEVEEDIFLKFQGRLRQADSPREGILLFNPNGHNWLWRRFIDPTRPDKWKRLYKCIEATTYDNPNLPADYLDQFEGLPDHWVQRYIFGSHEVFVGQIFTDWSPELHEVEPFLIPSSWERWRCIDPGIRHEGCVSWCARAPDGTIYYYREILETNQPVEWWAASIYEAEAADDWGGPDEEIYRDFIGPEARIRAQTDGRSVYDLFQEFGIVPEIADKDPVARISRITEYLRPRVLFTPPDRPGLAGYRGGFLHRSNTGTSEQDEMLAPRLLVFSDCEKLLEYLPQYRWKPQRTNFTEEDSPEKPRKKDDHNIDCLGHILVAMDDLPEIEGSPPTRDPEAEWADEHFEAELAAAAARAPHAPYRPGHVPSAV